MGRPRKPTAILRLTGSYNPTRHADRVDEVTGAGGSPIVPRGTLDKDARRMWDQVTKWMPDGLLARVDSGQLELCCRWYSISRKLMRQVENGEGSVFQASNATKTWQALASKLGLSPVDRANLQVNTDRAADDPLDDLIGKTG